MLNGSSARHRASAESRPPAAAGRARLHWSVVGCVPLVISTLGTGCQPALEGWNGRRTTVFAATPRDAGTDAPQADAAAEPAWADAGGEDSGADAAADAAAVDAGGFDAGATPETIGSEDDAGIAAFARRILARAADASDAGVRLTVAEGAVTVDGELSEWDTSEWVPLRYLSTWSVKDGTGSNEFAAACAWRSFENSLYLAVLVRDNVHANSHDGQELWQGDSVQVAFEVGQEGLPYDWEYGFAWVDERPRAHRWLRSDADVTDAFRFAIDRDGDFTLYEMEFTPEQLQLEHLEVSEIRLSVAVNDSDGDARGAALELTPGIVQSKSADAFSTLTW